ncbi:MAG: peptide chain release factor N(5)-glutamine methyltransferase [Anaerolineales bacterium]|nr:peptide chain release factor N(5)-glutamine methyltransferase [Anaerolineales bacterium]
MSERNSTNESVQELTSWARAQLEDLTDTPSLDAQLLMMRVLGVPRAWVLAHPEATLQPQQLEEFKSYVRRCAEGTALPYVIGRWEFFGRPFHVTPDVLIPRPETEHLVQVALGALARREDLRRVLEVGTGSGCVVVTLALEMEGRDYYASDISRPALDVASKNAREYRAQEQIDFVQADLLRGLRGPFDFVAANLPYIASDRLQTLKVGKREPDLALDGGQDGLEPLRSFVGPLRRSLRPGGELVLELDPEQMEAAESILGDAIPLDHVQVFDDLSGRARVLHVRRDPET